MKRLSILIILLWPLLFAGTVNVVVGQPASNPAAGEFGTKQALTYATAGTGTCAKNLTDYDAAGTDSAANDAFMAGITIATSTWEVKFMDFGGFTTSAANAQVIAGLLSASTIADCITGTATNTRLVTVSRFGNEDSGHPNKFVIIYTDTGGTVYFWKGSTTEWITNYNDAAIYYDCPSSGGAIDVRIKKGATNFEIFVTSSADNSDLVTGDPAIAISSVLDSSGTRTLAWGERFNDAWQVSSTATLGSIEK